MSDETKPNSATGRPRVTLKDLDIEERPETLLRELFDGASHDEAAHDAAAHGEAAAPQGEGDASISLWVKGVRVDLPANFREDALHRVLSVLGVIGALGAAPAAAATMAPDHTPEMTALFGPVADAAAVDAPQPSVLNSTDPSAPQDDPLLLGLGGPLSAAALGPRRDIGPRSDVPLPASGLLLAGALGVAAAAARRRRTQRDLQLGPRRDVDKK